MQYLIDDNIYILFSVVIFSIMHSDSYKLDRHKYLISYSLIYFMFLLYEVNFLLLFFILLAISFIHCELLSADNYKNQILSKIHFKILDWLFNIFFQFDLLQFILTFIPIFFLKLNYANGSSVYTLILIASFSVFCYLFSANYLLANSFKINSYTKMISKLNSCGDMDSFETKNISNFDILILREDKSFFIRKDNYTVLSKGFIKYKKEDNTIKIKNKLDNKYDEDSFVVYLLNNKTVKKAFISFLFLKNTLKSLKNFIAKMLKRKLYYRGYSTIEMQLIRTIGLEDGYNYKWKRKIFEVLYAYIVFNGYYRLSSKSYNTLSIQHYKNFLIYSYLTYAPSFLDKKKYDNILELFDIKNFCSISNEKLFLGTLSYSKKLIKENCHINYIENYYRSSIKQFGLNENTLKLALEELSKKII